MKQFSQLCLFIVLAALLTGCSGSNSKEGQKTLPGDYEGPPGGAKAGKSESN